MVRFISNCQSLSSGGTIEGFWFDDNVENFKKKLINFLIFSHNWSFWKILERYIKILYLVLQSTGGARGHFEPQVAMLCPEKGDLANKLFHNKFLSSSGNGVSGWSLEVMFFLPGKWESDTDMKATCKKDKVEILEYCKKVYPERDITNIVESSHYVKVSNWCKLGQKKCRSGSQQWVKPYRCLGESHQTWLTQVWFISRSC